MFRDEDGREDEAALPKPPAERGNARRGSGGCRARHLRTSSINRLPHVTSHSKSKLDDISYTHKRENKRFTLKQKELQYSLKKRRYYLLLIKIMYTADIFCFFILSQIISLVGNIKII